MLHELNVQHALGSADRSRSGGSGRRSVLTGSKAHAATPLATADERRRMTGRQPSHEARRAPILARVRRELVIIALEGHPDDRGTDAGPGVHPAGEGRHRGRLGLMPTVELHEAEGRGEGGTALLKRGHCRHPDCHSGGRTVIMLLPPSHVPVGRLRTPRTRRPADSKISRIASAVQEVSHADLYGGARAQGHYDGPAGRRTKTAIQTGKELSAKGKAARYIRSTFIPGEARCMCLFEAPNPQHVKELNESAEIPFSRIVEVMEMAGPVKGELKQRLIYSVVVLARAVITDE